MILSRSKDYYKNVKGRLREQARDKYRNLSEHGRNRYLKTNMSKEKKQKVKEYQKKSIVKTKKVKRLFIDLIMYPISLVIHF